jgi:DNA modification methylase
MNVIHFGDCRESLRAMAAAGVKVQTCVTSPPYFGLRDYGHAGQIGLEPTPEQFIAELVEVFRCVRDVLSDDGTLWVNIGDSYARNPSKGGSGPGGKNGAYSDSYTAANGRRAGEQGVGQRAPQLKVRAGAEGIKEKDLIGIPWMLAFALRTDGWYLRQDLIWHKPNPMPESVTDRCTKAHEYLFLLSKGPRYYFDSAAVKEPAINTRKPGRKIRDTRETHGTGGGNAGINNLLARYHSGDMPTHRNRRSVWEVATVPYKGAHFATFPPALIEPCILAGSRPGDIVLDPFMGSGTTAAVAIEHGRQFVGCELNPEYKPLQDERIAAAHALVAEREEARALAAAQLDMFAAGQSEAA